MSETKVAGKTYDIQILRRVLIYMRPYRGIFIWSIVLTLLMAAVAPLMPVLVEYTLDNYILKADMKGLGKMAVLMLVLLLVQTLVRYFHTLFTNVLGQSVIRDLRSDVFNHITQLRLKYFDHTPLGRLITRTVSDLETISEIFSQGLIQIIGDRKSVVVGR